MTDLERAYAALMGKQADQTKYWQYFDGDQATVYSTAHIRDVFKAIDVQFNANWCEVVITAVTDRINLNGFTVDNAQAQDVLDTLWDTLALQVEADDMHEAAEVTGEAVIIAGLDESGAPEAYYNDPRNVAVSYASSNPNRIQYAAKWWVDDDGRRRLTLYYADRTEYYVTEKAAAQVRSAKAFVRDPERIDDEPNDFATVPVFHFRLKRRLTKSALKSVLGPQDAINKLMTDMMIAAEFGAFPINYVISQMDSRGKLKTSPREIWDLPAGDGTGQATTVGQLAAAQLSNYLEAIDKLASTIGAITRTPKHYFFSQSGDPSGESLLAMEAPLNKKAQDRIDRYSPEWRRFGAFLLRLSGIEADANDVTPNYATPETVQPFTQAQVAATLTNVAEGALRIAGYSEEQIETYRADRALETPPVAPSPSEPAMQNAQESQP